MNFTQYGVSSFPELASLETRDEQIDLNIYEPIPLINFYGFSAVQNNKIIENVRLKCWFFVFEIDNRSIVG